MHKALIFANGDVNDGEMVRRALEAAAAMPGETLILAADGGARAAQHFKMRVQIVIGDMDSLSDAEQATLRAEGAELLPFPAEKNETDLELALTHAVAEGAHWIRIIGGVGDRLDQTLSNVYLLALPVLHQLDTRLVAGVQEAWLAQTGTHPILGAKGDTISLIPLSGVARGIVTEGLYYPLRDEDLHFGPARGVSNVLSDDRASVTVREGALLIVHTIGRA
ncbi:MAG: thiamine diphosphokinase [Chloroflexota bacterium]|nr:thiamine diphosphokinase [Chloroflexota bacterium]